MAIVTTLLFALITFIAAQRENETQSIGLFKTNIYRNFKRLPFNGSDTVPEGYTIMSKEDLK